MSDINRAKYKAFVAFSNTLDYLQSKPKGKDYGIHETEDSHWDKLPAVSKSVWLERTA